MAIEKTEYGFTGSLADLPPWARDNPELGILGAFTAVAQFEKHASCDHAAWYRIAGTGELSPLQCPDCQMRMRD